MMFSDQRRLPSLCQAIGIILLTVAAGSATGAQAQARSPSDRHIQRPPYYTGSRVAPTARTAHLPVTYQRGSTHQPIFDPSGGDGTPVAALLAEMNAFLDSLGATVRLKGATPIGNPPDVHFGCELDPGGDCIPREETARNTMMRLAVDRPNRAWVSAVGAAMAEGGAERAIVITLEVGQYWTRQQGLRGDKMVDLGTGHSIRLPWLTSLETPVSVLQLTGALIDGQGRVLRIGAEGMIARRTPLLVSSLRAQALLRDEDVLEAATARRDDLAGEPLAWQVALKQLVSQLTGRSDVAAR